MTDDDQQTDDSGNTGAGGASGDSTPPAPDPSTHTPNTIGVRNTGDDTKAQSRKDN